ncbi:MAG: GDSL-type esterase/lipase family protein [Deltaproteobacteria bacterium]|nr:GDSL-type esterase/lipase family protein [Deltaproteobacteria bacterium]
MPSKNVFRMPAASLAAVVAAVVMAAAIASPRPAAAADHNLPFTSIVALGDSFSDDGFADGWGFKRYTETSTWVEQLAAATGLPLENRAWGGAMSNQRNCNHPEGTDWSGLDWQVDDYLKNLAPGTDISKVLFTVVAGSNDLWGGIEDGAVSAANIRAAVEKLAAAGAKFVLYGETPGVLLAPGYLTGDYVSYAEPWLKLVADTNAVTRQELEGGLAQYPDLKIYYVRTDPLMEKIKNKEDGYVFENITDKWWGTYSYPEPGKYLWYDEWHPMGHFHSLICREALAALTAK